MEQAKFYDVPSATIKGKDYKVRYTPEKGWRCSCLGFVAHSRRIGYCKHIRGLLAERGVEVDG